MTEDNVRLNLMLMGVTEKTFSRISVPCGCEEEEGNSGQGVGLLDLLCRTRYANARKRMLSELGYHREDDDVPDVLEPYVDNWAAAEILKYLRIRDPATYATYVKYMSEGIHTRQYGLLDQSKSQDPIAILSAVPYALIAEWRRL